MKRFITNLLIILQFVLPFSGMTQLCAQITQVVACNDTIVCESSPAQLSASGVTTYVWTPSNSLSCMYCQNPVATPTVTTTYTIGGVTPIDIAINGNFSAGNTGFTSDYIYTSGSLQNEGKYGVGTNPNSYENSFCTTPDHTSGGGNYMIVNGATVGNQIVWSQTLSVTPNTPYNFDCWALSLYSFSSASLQLSVNGTNIGPLFAVTPATNNWMFMTASWNSGANVTATLRIIDVNTAGFGNDFGLDDIAFWWPQTSQDSVTVSVNPKPVVNITSSTNASCGSSCVDFLDESTIANPATIVSWNWNFGDGNNSAVQNPSHCYTSPGANDITLTVTSDSGCAATTTYNDYVIVGSGPVAQIGVNGTEKPISYPNFQFENTGSNYTNSFWDFGDGNTSTDLNPYHTYADTGYYVVQLIVTNPMGCSDTTYLTVRVELPWTLYLPNAFSPNGDGKNDVFAPGATYIESFSMQIYDRWGNLICNTSDIASGWDGTYHGKKCEEGVYIYSVLFVGNTGEENSKIGRVTLVR
jgi:gliding motility-associated-like protein